MSAANNFDQLPHHNHAEMLQDSPRAWLMAGAAFFTCFIVFGVFFSFGAFFKPMVAQFGASHAGASAVFAITACLSNLLGVVGGHLSDRFGPRRVILIGAVTIGIGLIATSHIEHLWLAYFTYGIGVGVGIAFTYVPVLGMVAGWFLTQRTAALGITVSGIGCGTLVFAPLAAAAIQRLGWRQSYVLMGAMAATGLVICASLVEAPPLTSQARRIRLTAVIRTRPFVLLYLSSLFISLAVFVPFVYLPTFAQLHGASEVRAAALVGFVGAASVVGRLGLGALAGRFEALKLYKVCALTMGLSFTMWACHGLYRWLVLFTIVMGSAYGGWVVLLPSVVAEIFGVEGLGATLGVLYSGSALSAIVGTPLAGFIIDKTGDYLGAAILAGTTALIGFLIVLPLRHKLVAIAH
jgi:MFS family permease